MIASYVLLVCFLILLTKKDKSIRLISLMCMGHIIIENLLRFYFYHNISNFDFSLYLNITSFLDVFLIYGISCVVTQLKKKILVGFIVPLILCQLVVIQYPYLFPEWVFSFSINSYYINMMESFLFISSFSETNDSIKEWLKLSLIMFCLFVIHFLL